MTGLELSRSYWIDVVEPALVRGAPGLAERTAAGLVGPGSECLGLDDAVSRDHDWGPRVCLWVPGDMDRRDVDRLWELYRGLDPTHRGFGPVRRLEHPFPRDGVIPIGAFYRAYLGTDREPLELRDWLLMPETGLALCTSGEVFRDDLGLFSAMRDRLSGYYPEDVRLKKIAARCRAAGRHGQYDLLRAQTRDDLLAVHHHRDRFVSEAASLVFHAERRYRPHGKWMFRMLDDLASFGRRIHTALEGVVGAGTDSELNTAIERAAEALLEGLGAAGVIQRGSRTESFLGAYAEDIESGIEDEDLRRLSDSALV